MLPLNRQVGRLPSLLLTLTLILFFSLPPLHLHGAELARRPFAIPAADAEVTLETFSDQAGAQVVYLIEDVRGVTTNLVQGPFAIRDALERLVARTALRVEVDGKTGAFVIKRDRAQRPTTESPNRTSTPPTNTMKKSPKTLLAAVAGWLAASAAVDAQNVTPPKAEPVVLSPFEVISDESNGYDATNTNSLTGIKSSLNEVPVDARILTKKMMSELGGGDVFKLLSDFGGLGAMLQNSGSESQRGMQEGDMIQPEGQSGRGFSMGTPRRDGFLRSATSSMGSFDVESADVINGSNNLLYGSGDASGVIVINSKRAAVNRRNLTVTTKFDSEGSNVHTLDANYGTQRIGVRVNALKSTDRIYKPILGSEQEGLQASLTLRPYKWVSIFGDYRNYTRSVAHSSYIGMAVLRVPVSAGLVLNNGLNLDNQEANYVVGVGGSALLNNLVTYTNADSLFGPVNRQHWTNKSHSVTVDLTPSKDFALQLRYGRDVRLNVHLQPTNTTFFSPDHPSNGYRNANGNRIQEWASNTSIASNQFTTGAEGVRLTTVGRRDLGRFGEHRLNGFYSKQREWKLAYYGMFYEEDAAGNLVQNLANLSNGNSGRTVAPSEWRPMFSTALPFRMTDWPQASFIGADGKRYRWARTTSPSAVPPTAGNPQGISGPINAAGQPTSSSYVDRTPEEGWGTNFASKFWKGRIDTMASYTQQTSEYARLTTGLRRGPISYDSKAFGAVVDTPIQGVRVFANHAVNSKVNFNIDRDINNNVLPIGSGKSDDVGFKLSMWDHRVSGSITYYVTEQLNNAASLGSFQNAVDPDGINGRHGGAGYVFSRKSDGLSVSLSVRPLKPWQITASLTQANGSERSNITLPIFYNDAFNTTTVGGQPVVAVRNGSTLTPLSVPSDPAKAASTPVVLSLAMMKDRTSPYFATLDPESGQIINAQFLGLRTSGVGTGENGLPISAHQLGFVPPTQEIIVRKAGEQTTGYAESAYGIINRYQFSEDRLKGLVAGLSTIYQRNFRAYRYTDVADGGKRKNFYYPEKFQNNLFLVYNFKGFAKTRMSVQVNIDNVFDKQEIIALPRSSNGVIRYFTEQYSPRKSALTLSVMF